MSHSRDESKIVDDGRYVIFDSFEEEVERTNDYGYAVARADANSGYVTDRSKSSRHPSGPVIYDSEDE